MKGSVKKRFVAFSNAYNSKFGDSTCANGIGRTRGRKSRNATTPGDDSRSEPMLTATAVELGDV